MNTCFSTRALALLALVASCIAGCSSQLHSNPGVIVSPTTLLLTPEPSVTATSTRASTAIPTAINVPASVTATPSVAPAAPVATSAASPLPIASIPLGVTSIEIGSRDRHKTIAVGETAAVVVTDQFIPVLLHLSQPLTGKQRQNVRVELDPNNWQVEYRQAPTADTFAFALRGQRPGRTDIQISDLPGSVPLHFALQVLAPTPAPTRTVAAAARVIRLSDADRTIHLQVGERAVLQFPAGNLLDLKQTDWSILEVVEQSMSSALLVARHIGRTTLTLNLISGCPRPNLHCVPVGTDLVFHFIVE